MQGEASTRLGFTATSAWSSCGPRSSGGAVARAGAGASEGVGIRRLRHHPRLCAHRSLGEGPRRSGLGGGHRAALGTLALLPHRLEGAGKRRTARR